MKLSVDSRRVCVDRRAIMPSAVTTHHPLWRAYPSRVVCNAFGSCLKVCVCCVSVSVMCRDVRAIEAAHVGKWIKEAAAKRGKNN